jgi:ribosome biogenesis protein MAK21
MLSKQNNDFNSIQNEDSDEEEEKYEDLPMSDDENLTLNNSEPNQLESNKAEVPKNSSVSWLHNKNINTNRTKSKYYDPNGRNPLYASAESVDLWELEFMRNHFHPSTKLFTEKILNNTFIDYDGDPLNDFSLKHFLDRFVFRNPKKLNKRSAAAKGSHVFGRIHSSDKPLPAINSDEYINQPENKIPVDEKFIYNYLKQRVSSKDNDESDLESVTSVEFERLLDHYEPGNRKERNIDFANYFSEANKSKASKEDQEQDDDSNDEFFDEIDNEEDEELDFDADDKEFADAFEGVDSELDEALEESSEKKRPKKQKKGFDKVTNDLFASADEFAELLEQNQLDSDLSDDEEIDEQNSQSFKSSKKRIKKPKLGRKRKKIKFNKDLDL